MTNMNSDIDLFKRLRRILKRHILMLKDSESIYEKDDIYDEILGALIDARVVDDTANPAYVYMANAYLDAARDSPQSDVISALETLDRTFAVLEQRYNEVVSYNDKA